MKRHMHALVHSLTTGKVVFRDDGLDALEEIDTLERFFAERFAYLKRWRALRNENLQALEGETYRLVSLGFDCFIRTLSNRWGIKPTKAMGEPTLPFDLATHDPEGVAALIDNAFEGYLDPASLTQDDRQFWCNYRYRACFSHEPADTDLDGLLERYQRRVRDFDAVMDGSRPVLFCQHLEASMPESRLYTVLKERYASIDFSLCIIKTYPAEDEVYRIETPADDYSILHISYPFSGYVWYRAEDYAAAEGLAFELKTVTYLKEKLKALLERNRS